jgi:hypothetical protein
MGISEVRTLRIIPRLWCFTVFCCELWRKHNYIDINRANGQGLRVKKRIYNSSSPSVESVSRIFSNGSIRRGGGGEASITLKGHSTG